MGELLLVGSARRKEQAETASHKASDIARARFRDALKIYDAVSPDDSHWKAHFYLGVLAVEAKETDEAVDQLESASARFPHQGAVHFYLAKAYELKGCYHRMKLQLPL